MSNPHRRNAKIPLAIFSALSLFFLSHASAGLIHDYRLNGTFADSLGGPSLVPGGPFGVGTLTANGYAFGRSQGLSLSNALPNTANYSILIDFNFSDLSSFRKIVDFVNLTSDTGLYDLNTAVSFFPAVNGAQGAFQPNVAVRLVLTRDSGSGLVSCYVNGALQLQFVDSSGNGIFGGPNGIMQFLNDDSATGGNESSAGAVTRLALFDAPLNAGEVAALGGPGGAVPEPGSAVILLLGGACLWALRRRR